MSFIEKQNLNHDQMHLWNKIPTDVFINHIIPYTYKKIDHNLLNDIRNFRRDYQLITDYYYCGLNEYCLLNDIILFCNNKPLSDIVNYEFVNINNSLIDILNRNIIFKKLPLGEKYNYIRQKFYYNLSSNTQLKNKFILSLLTPRERASFINKHIIEYYD